MAQCVRLCEFNAAMQSVSGTSRRHLSRNNTAFSSVNLRRALQESSALNLGGRERKRESAFFFTSLPPWRASFHGEQLESSQRHERPVCPSRAAQPGELCLCICVQMSVCVCGFHCKQKVRAAMALGKAFFVGKNNANEQCEKCLTVLFAFFAFKPIVQFKIKFIFTHSHAV